VIRSLHRTSDGHFVTALSPAGYPAAIADPKSLLWVDFQGEPPEVCEPILREGFGFHPLAIDDALQETHVPKIDDWGQYVYIALHSIELLNDGGAELQVMELDAFMGKNYLVTHHDLPIPALDHEWERCMKDERHTTVGPDHLLYELIDTLVTGYMQTVEKMDDVLEEIEDELFENPTSTALGRLIDLKRALLHLRRTVSPQREVLNKLARDDYPVVDAKDRVYFRDVYDHLVRLHDINESMRDQVGGAMEIYLSVVNNRLNEVMKTLTIITTLFMPISFVVGFFGMNFFQPIIPSNVWTSAPALTVTLGILFLTPLVMFLWLRRRRWM